MIAQLTDAQKPALADLTTRDRDDFTIALLDSFSVVADVLAFYNERLVNEAYMRTALDRVSLQELGKLIGYQLDPGAAADVHLAFSMEHPPTIPANQPKDPGSTPSVTPSVVTLETGLRVQSIPGPGEKPQMFETVETIDARPEWNAIPVTTTIAWNPLASNVKEAWLEGVGLNLSPGDALLLSGTNIKGERWDLRILEKVEPDPEANHTKVSWSEALGSETPKILPAANPEAFVLRKRVNVFGHNAPMWGSMSSKFQKGYPNGGTGLYEWPEFNISSETGNVVDLDGSHPDIVVGSWVVLNEPDYRELWEVDTVAELSRAEFAVSGKVTRLTLVKGENYSRYKTKVRETTTFAVSEPLTIAEQPDLSDVTSDNITTAADVSAMKPGRSVIVAGTTTAGVKASEVAVVKSVSVSKKIWTIVFEDDLTNDYDRSSAIVHGNVALATHGESVTEILGSGRGSEAFQQFFLARKALTFVQSSDPSGTSTTLKVRVNGVAWKESPTLYDQGLSDKKYSVRSDEQGRIGVRFGDGADGSRLPTGNQNIVAEYRHGIGVAGNVGAGSLAQLLDRPLGAKGVTNPAKADGGVDPEEVAAARSTMPRRVRTLDRAVSILDYADFAQAVTGVSKSHAAVLPIHGVRTIIVTVAFTPGTVTDTATKAGDIESSLRDYGDPQVEVKVVSHNQTSFRIGMSVVVDASYDTTEVTKAVKKKILEEFAFEQRHLTELLHRSEIIAIAHAVKGITSVDIDNLYTGSVPDLNDRLLPTLPSVTSSGVVTPAGLLVVDSDPFDSLAVTT